MEFIRSVRNPAWAPLAIDSSAIDAAVDDLMADAEDGVSVYAYANEAERKLACVGLMETRESADLRFVRFTLADLERIGIRVEATPGDTGVTEAVRLHRDLHLTRETASVLVRLVASRSQGGKVTEKVPKKTLKAWARELAQQGVFIPPGSWL